MSNLEVMERAINFTTNYYIEHPPKNVSNIDLQNLAIDYSSRALMDVLQSKDGLSKAYTREGNLRRDVASIGKDGIKTELLKNVVNVGVYNRMRNTRAAKQMGNNFGDDLSDDEIAVIILNNIETYGVEKGYELIN